MSQGGCGVGDSNRRAPRWGPNRTPRAATVGSLRSGPRRLYPHRGARLAGLQMTPVAVPERHRTGLKTINP